ncbi:MAG TPA: YgiQ family radical SAM protein, partial [Polyangiaceae bacterium]
AVAVSVAGAEAVSVAGAVAESVAGAEAVSVAGAEAVSVAGAACKHEPPARTRTRAPSGSSFGPNSDAIQCRKNYAGIRWLTPATLFRMPRDALFAYPPFWAKCFGQAEVLPRSRAEMDQLGWEACDVILVTGDAYVDHPSFGMALIGRLLEAQGYRVGILDQPQWRDTGAFTALGEPTLFFGVTAGNMDSLVNHYTSEKKPRSDDAYTPDRVAGKRPDRACIVYTQRCREAYPNTPVILGGIEASLRRLSHYDYWSDKVRRSILVDSGADLLVYGNAERAIVEVAHRLARGTPARAILDVRGTVVRRATGPEGPVDAASGQYRVEVPRALASVEPQRARPNPYAEVATASVCDVTAPHQPTKDNDARALIGPGRNGTRVTAGDGSLRQASDAADERTSRQASDAADERTSRQAPRERVVLRLPSSDAVTADAVLYAQAARIAHLESNPHNARCLVQRNGDTDVWVNPPAWPLSTSEMDALYDLPYTRRPHPDYAGKPIAAYEMIRFSVAIQRGCFGGCAFCSITEHEGRIIQSRSVASVQRELGQLQSVPGFTGVVSDLGGPTANMYRMGCNDPDIQSKCRRMSCLYPSICRNLNHDHGPLIQLYRTARKTPGIQKLLIGSGIRYDLAVQSPEYVKELVTYHVGGYLKIAPEHISAGPLAKMMKPGIAAYHQFKALFDRYSAAAGKQQYLIPYFIAAHPGTSDADMLELACWLKRQEYRLDQVQLFLPSPMSLATTMYHTGKNPLTTIERGAGDVSTVKSTEARTLHKAFLRYHDPQNWGVLRRALLRMGRDELIGHGPNHLVPPAAGEHRSPGRVRTR